MARGGEAGVRAGAVPVVAAGEQGHGWAFDGRFLDDVAQYVVAAVAVDEDETVGAGAPQRGSDVGDDGDEGGGADAGRSWPGGVLVGAGHGDGG